MCENYKSKLNELIGVSPRTVFVNYRIFREKHNVKIPYGPESQKKKLSSWLIIWCDSEIFFSLLRDLHSHVVF